MQDDQASVGSVESVPGGFIPPVQGAGLLGEQLYMSAEEEIRRTVHAWRGADMPAQLVVSVQDVEALARDVQRALQDTTSSAVEDIAPHSGDWRDIWTSGGGVWRNGF